MNIDYTTYCSQGKNFRQRYLVLHYTAENFANSVASLTGPTVSVHYLVPTLKTIDPSYPHDDLTIYSLVDETERAWHAGISSWQDSQNINDTSIGIEIVNMSTGIQFEPYPPAQIDLVIQLCKNIIARYPDITSTRIVGHSDIAVGRKQDPGPLFPWQQLYENGIGAWFDQPTVAKYLAKFKQKMPTLAEVINKLTDYGYVKDFPQPVDLIKAFQMHFRSSDYSGNLDVETAAITYALWEKYV